MNKTEIEWCSHSWNPVTGCLHGCSYCYAREQAHRFAGGGYGKQEAKGRGGYTTPFVGLRRKEECAFMPMSDEEQKWMVLSVMKRREDTTWKERRARGQSSP